MLSFVTEFHQYSKSMSHIYDMQQYCLLRKASVLLTLQYFWSWVVLDNKIFKSIQIM